MAASGTAPSTKILVLSSGDARCLSTKSIVQSVFLLYFFFTVWHILSSHRSLQKILNG